MLLAAAGLASALAALLPFSWMRGQIDRYAADGAAEPYTPALHQRLQFAALALAAALLAGARLIDWKRDRVSAAIDRFVRHARRHAALLAGAARRDVAAFFWPTAALTLLAALVRVPFLNQPIRFDEAHTFLEYAAQPWFVAVSKYDAPNNHVLHSLCVLLSTRMFGEAEWAIRLPALLAGIALVPATMKLAQITSGNGAAAFAGLLAAVSSPLIEYSTSARGYSLIGLFTVVGWLGLLSAVRGANPAGWIFWGLSAVLGCWTIPVMIYPIAMQVAWLSGCILRCRSRTRRRLLAGRGLTMLAWSGIAVLLLYAPILLVAGPSALVANPYVTRLTRSAFIERLPQWLGSVSSLLARDLPQPVLGLLLAAAVYACLPGMRRGPARLAAALSVLVPLMLVFLQRVHPFPRVWVFLLPLAFALSAAGLADASLRFPRAARPAFQGALFLMLGVWPLWTLWSSNSILSSTAGGSLPEAEQIILDLKPVLADGEPIVAVSPSTQQLVYYARRHGLDPHHFNWPGAGRTRSDCAAVIVHKGEGQTLQSVLSALSLNDTTGRLPLQLWQDYPQASVYRAASPP